MFENFQDKKLAEVSTKLKKDRDRIVIGLDGNFSSRIFVREFQKGKPLESQDFKAYVGKEKKFAFTSIPFEAVIEELCEVVQRDVEREVLKKMRKRFITQDRPKIIIDKMGNKYLSVGVQVFGCSSEGKFFYRKDTYYTARFLSRYMFYFYEYLKNNLDTDSIHIPEEEVEKI